VFAQKCHKPLKTKTGLHIAVQTGSEIASVDSLDHQSHGGGR
jgi:hypothetical protein